MRDIKFRGKVLDEPNEWVYGYLSSKDAIYQDKETENTKCCGIGTFKVDTETIGQYTGLKDENDIEIFEGDIIDFSYDMFVGNFNTFVAKGIVVFEEGAFYVQCLENERLTKDESYLLYTINIDTIEVIGNIYNNPELLKGEQS